MTHASQPADFSGLTPDTVLDLVEEALDVRANFCRPMTSYINRVYDIECRDGSWVVAKFYRPGRWSIEALRDEQTFLFELAEQDIPVIAPLEGVDGQTLHIRGDLRYAVFPKRGGRPCEEPTDAQWLELGRLLARMHQVGACGPARDRVRLGPRHASAEHVRFILDAHVIPERLHAAYVRATEGLLDEIAPFFEGVESIRIHGDCHRNNILSRPGEPFALIDFDDMAVGPPVQDIWMLLPGRARDARREMELFLEGYETFRPFDRSTVRLIEPLRALRFLHFTAWCARQQADGGFARLAPDWGTDAYWQREIDALERQRVEIRDDQSGIAEGHPFA